MVMSRFTLASASGSGQKAVRFARKERSFMRGVPNGEIDPKRKLPLRLTIGSFWHQSGSPVVGNSTGRLRYLKWKHHQLSGTQPSSNIWAIRYGSREVVSRTG